MSASTFGWIVPLKRALNGRMEDSTLQNTVESCSRNIHEEIKILKPAVLHSVNPHPLGLVYVFDLDHTIVGDYFHIHKHPQREVPFNPLCLHMLSYLVKEREKGNVTAVFLLTNNSDEIFISFVHHELKGVIFGNPFSHKTVFDDIFDARHPERQLVKEGLMAGTHKKSLKDVENMLKGIQKSSEKLIERCVFIDDQIYHHLCTELITAGKGHHFIHICPPFIKKSFRSFSQKRSAFVVKPFPHLLGSGPWK